MHCRLGISCSTTPQSRHLLTVDAQRPTPSTCPGVSAQSPYKTSHTTSSCTLMESPWVIAFVTFTHSMGPEPRSWLRSYSVPGLLCHPRLMIQPPSDSMRAPTTGRLSEVHLGDLLGHTIPYAWAHRSTTDIVECTPLLVNRHDTAKQEAARLEGSTMASGVGSFTWTPYDDPVLQDICPLCLKEEAEWGTWISVVPLVFFNIVEFHHLDRVKRQFNGEQLVSGDPVNVDKFLDYNGPRRRRLVTYKLHEWYDRWRVRFGERHCISIQPCFDYRPTQEYWNWYRLACRVRHLSESSPSTFMSSTRLAT
ncbi:Serine/threonine protein phosphatase 7 long form isogeny [Arachis hypogaea]|nr:Serine/threonine protein phosphatase 7 long form isogeny [Arachis hypogaea]